MGANGPLCFRGISCHALTDPPLIGTFVRMESTMSQADARVSSKRLNSKPFHLTFPVLINSSSRRHCALMVCLLHLVVTTTTFCTWFGRYNMSRCLLASVKRASDIWYKYKTATTSEPLLYLKLMRTHVVPLIHCTHEDAINSLILSKIFWSLRSSPPSNPGVSMRTIERSGCRLLSYRMGVGEASTLLGVIVSFTIATLWPTAVLMNYNQRLSSTGEEVVTETFLQCSFPLHLYPDWKIKYKSPCTIIESWKLTG